MLRDAGLRPTSPRMYVLSVIDSAPRAFTAEQVFQHLGALDIAISQATVYRALNDLEQHKLLVRSRLQDASDNKVRYTASAAAPRASACTFVCRNCGKHVAVADPAFNDQLQRQAQACGFDAQPGTIHIAITCAHCT